MSRVRSDYLHSVLAPDSAEKVVDAMTTAVRSIKRNRFSAIAFRGMSGALVAPRLAAAWRKHLIAVRKDGDGAHSRERVEGLSGIYNYLIVDDFIQTGNTVNGIYDAMALYRPNANCVGIALYNSYAEFPDYALHSGSHGHLQVVPVVHCGKLHGQRV